MLTDKNAVCESSIALPFYLCHQNYCTAQRETRGWYKEFLAFNRTGPGSGKPILVLKTILGGGVHFSESSAGGPSAELSKVQSFQASSHIHAVYLNMFLEWM